MKSTVTVIDGATNTTANVTVGSWPKAIEVNPVTNKTYVTIFPGNTVKVIDGATNSTAAVTVGSNPNAIAVNPVTNKIYVANSGGTTVTVIDGATNTTATVSLGSGPQAIAVNPVTNKIYVTISGGTTVTVIDGATNSTSTVTVGSSPQAIAVNPVTNKVYVANYNSNDVTVIDGATNATTTVTVGTGPQGVAVNAVTNRVYVTNYSSDSMTVLDGATDSVTATVAMGIRPGGIAVNPITNTIYVANGGSNTVTAIDGATDAVTANMTAGTSPSNIVVNPVTNKVYAANWNSANVTVIDGAINATATVAAGTGPLAFAMNPVTNKIYIANSGSSNVTVINGATNATATVPTGSTPYALAVNPVTNKIYVANLGSDNVAVIDGVTNAAAIVATGGSPKAVAVNPVTNKIYVMNGSSSTVTVIDGATNSTVTVNVGTDPDGIAVNPVTNKIYVANYSSANVTVIDGATNTTVSVNAGTGPSAIAVNSVTNKIYVANGSSSTVTVIDGATNSTVPVTAGTYPSDIAVNAVTNKIYVANSSSGNVTVIDGATNSTSTVSLGTNPYFIAVNAVSNKIYTANSDNNIAMVIDGATNATVTVATGTYPTAIAVNYVSSKIYVANYNSSNVTVITEQQVQTIPLSAAITALTGNQTASPTPSFTFNANSTFSPTAPAPQNVFFQVDTWQGSWTRATAGSGSFTGTTSSLQPGLHIVYAFAGDGQDATSVQPGSPLISNIAAYEFLVTPPHFAVSAPATATYNTALSVTVTAQDASNSTLTTYAGTVHFTSTDAAAVLPTDSTLTSGVGTFNVTFKTLGAQTVTATDTVTSAINGVAALTVVKATATVTLGSLAQIYSGTARTATATTVPAVLTVNFTYDGSAAAPTAVGSYAVVATVSDTNYQGTASGTLVISKLAQTIIFIQPSNVQFGAAPFTLAASATSGLPVTFSVAGPASLSGNTVMNFGAGAVTITASQAGNATYDPAPNVSQSFVVYRAGAQITLGGLNQTYDGTAKSVTVRSSPTLYLFNITYGGSLMAPTAAGSYPVVATVMDPNYAGSATGTLVIEKATAAITLSGLNANYSGAAKPVSATTNPAGLTVNLTYNGSATAPSAVGTYTVTATVVNDNYTGTTSQTLTIAKREQSVTFASIGNVTVGAPVALSATTDSALLVTFAVVSGPATISGSTLSLTGFPGVVVVRASQAGDATWGAAAEVTQTFTVAPVGPQIYFGSVTGGGQNAEFAASIASNGQSGSMIGTLPALGEAFALTFAPDAKGDWVATVATTTGAGSGTSGGNRTFRGHMADGVLAGMIDGTTFTFNASLQSCLGRSAAIAGYYCGSSLNTCTGATHIVVGTDGRVFLLSITPLVVAGGSGTVNSNGSFTVQVAAQTTISGAVDAATSTLAGSIAAAGRPAENFAGLNSGTLRCNPLVNLSTRGQVGADGGAPLIAGFVLTGTTGKQVLIRAVGPGLTGFGVSGALTNPLLRIYRANGSLVAENDDWGSNPEVAAAAVRTGAFVLAPGSRDAAALVTLAPGAYTVHVLGSGGGAGVALAEIYDAGYNARSDAERAINISARGFVDASDGALISGFVVTGNAPKLVLVRGIGPTLSAFGVTGALADPGLKIFNARGELVAQNDNWSVPSSVSATQVSATSTLIADANGHAGAFALPAGSKDAAVLLMLATGAYTAQVFGVSGTTGSALVEIYEVPD